VAEWEKECEGVAEMSPQDKDRLTPTERRLLTCLVRNAGQTVSHKELLEATSLRNTSISNLRAYIGRLRKKIEIDPALPRVIVTHYGLGYSFAGNEEARWFLENES
jgi:two-component system KDP operon response regulator KdpE